MNKLFTTCLLLLLSQYCLAKISVHVDRDLIVADESFQLIFETDAKVDAEPDFSPLNKSFTVLNRRLSSNTQILNGKISQSRQWILTVLAKQSAKLEIPSIRFGKEKTPPYSINVLTKPSSVKGAVKDDIFLDVEVDTTRPYVQAQLIYTVRLYRAVQTSHARLSEPNITGGQAVINKLGEDKNFDIRRHGKRYRVLERRFVIFPQSSGRLTIEPLIFQAQTGAGGFFNLDPFGARPKSIVKRSEQIELIVKPIPATLSGQHWLPASQLILQEHWSIDPGELKQGEAVTRTLTLQANGLTASQLPATDRQLPDKFKQYPDQPEFEEGQDSKGLMGIRRDKMAVIPTEGGEYVLPAISVPWWNTDKDQMELFELPERTIKVEAVATLTRDDPLPTAAIEDQIVSEPVPVPAHGNRVLSDNGVLAASSAWKWISITVFILWLLTLLLWRYSTRKPENKNAIKHENKLSEKACLNDIRHACRHNNAHAAKDALIFWAQVHFSDISINSLSAIKSFSDKELQEKLDELNHHLYGQSGTTWNGDYFLTTFLSRSFASEQGKQTFSKLEPLYKT